jgi:hypothetical protein
MPGGSVGAGPGMKGFSSASSAGGDHRLGERRHHVSAFAPLMAQTSVRLDL